MPDHACVSDKCELVDTVRTVNALIMIYVATVSIRPAVVTCLYIITVSAVHQHSNYSN